jgi:methylthioribose-1-phosphate isomerase
MSFYTIEWKNNSVRILDQTKLPGKEKYLTIKTVKRLADAIKNLSVRGAPAIGVAAGYGVALSSYNMRNHSIKKAKQKIKADISLMKKTRPTAVNLFWALDRMKNIVSRYGGLDSETLFSLLLKEAKRIHKEDRELCRRIGEHGARIVPRNAKIMTHCNAGALATGGWGTALGVIYAASKKGKRIHVYAGETRPLLQGARLTVWELQKNSIPVTLVVDSARATVLKNNNIDLIIVGADRIASNGDVANKIGTYPLSVLAKRYKVDFYVAAPSTTFDLSVKSGSEIPIEERSPQEVRTFSGARVSTASVSVYNPAFDITPHNLISGIITERGILRKPFSKSIRMFLKKHRL